MADDKKSDDGKGTPPSAAQNTAETPAPQPPDSRLIPGGSLAAARRPIGVNAFDHYTEQPSIKADLPDLSETPGWHMVPKPDRRA
jgi:hypothetical protein